ncbi:MAG: hypothetical protein NVS4B7_01530 [Ktedonobacteraceae bacterium]
MGRRILAIILILLAISIATMTAAFTFPSIGARIFAQATSTPPPAFPTPLPPIPTAQPTPILTVVGEPPKLNDKATYLLDADTGHTLDDFHGEIPLPMASTTKIMTAVIAIETGNLDQIITVKQDAINEVANNGGSAAYLKVGDKLMLKDLLYGLMLPSGDDAAITIADGISGSQDNFVHAMNIFAYRLHLFQTSYINADGLTYYSAPNVPVPGHYTTAYDLVRLAQYAMKIPLFAQIVSTGKYVLPPTGFHHGYTWINTNDLLGTHPEEFPAYAGTTGIKTGFTFEAGYCLVFSATRNNQQLIGVVLFDTATDAAQRFRDAKKLLDWGFGLPLRIATNP